MPEIDNRNLEIFRYYLSSRYAKFMNWKDFLAKYELGEIDEDEEGCDIG